MTSTPAPLEENRAEAKSSRESLVIPIPPALSRRESSRSAFDTFVQEEARFEFFLGLNESTLSRRMFASVYRDTLAQGRLMKLRVFQIIGLPGRMHSVRLQFLPWKISCTTPFPLPTSCTAAGISLTFTDNTVAPIWRGNLISTAGLVGLRDFAQATVVSTVIDASGEKFSGSEELPATDRKANTISIPIKIGHDAGALRVTYILQSYQAPPDDGSSQ